LQDRGDEGVANRHELHLPVRILELGKVDHPILQSEWCTILADYLVTVKIFNCLVTTCGKASCGDSPMFVAKCIRRLGSQMGFLPHWNQ